MSRNLSVVSAINSAINSAYSHPGNTVSSAFPDFFTVPEGVTTLYVSGTAAGGEGGSPSPPTYSYYGVLLRSSKLRIGYSGSDIGGNYGHGVTQFLGLPAFGGTYTDNTSFLSRSYLNYGEATYHSYIPRLTKTSPSGALTFTPETFYNLTGYYVTAKVGYRYGKPRNSLAQYASGQGVSDTIIVSDLLAAYTGESSIVYTKDGWETSATASLSGGPLNFVSTNANLVNCRRVRYLDGKFVTVGNSSSVGYTNNNYVLSVDPITGTAQTTLITSDGNALYDIGYNGSVWVAVGINGKVWYCSTLTGTWAAATLSGLSTAVVYSVEVGGPTGDTFMIGCAGGLVYSSTNGSTWTQRSTGLASEIVSYNIAYQALSNKWFVCSRNSGAMTTSGNLRSAMHSDLNSWSTAATNSKGGNYVWLAGDGTVNFWGHAGTAVGQPDHKFSTDGSTFSSDTFTDIEYDSRGGHTAIARNGVRIFDLVGGGFGRQSEGRPYTGSYGYGGSSYGNGTANYGEGGCGGYGAPDATGWLNNSTQAAISGTDPSARFASSPRAGDGGAMGCVGGGVAISVLDLPETGWPRKLAGGGGAVCGGPHSASNYAGSAGGGSCFGSAGGFVYTSTTAVNNTANNSTCTLRQASGPGAGGSNTYASGPSTGGGAGEGAWRYPLAVTPGEVLALWPGIPSSIMACKGADWGPGTNAAQPGMLTVEWRA